MKQLTPAGDGQPWRCRCGFLGKDNKAEVCPMCGKKNISGEDD